MVGSDFIMRIDRKNHSIRPDRIGKHQQTKTNKDGFEQKFFHVLFPPDISKNAKKEKRIKKNPGLNPEIF
jgi:hypothetical protein